MLAVGNVRAAAVARARTFSRRISRSTAVLPVDDYNCFEKPTPMKTFICLNRKTACLIAIAVLPWFAAQAEDRPKPATPTATTKPEPTRYDLEVIDGRLQLEKIKDRINHNPAWGSSSSVEARLKNIADVLRDLNPNINITVSPEAEGIRIDNLKLRGLSIEGQLDALIVASGKRIRWSNTGDSYLIFMRPLEIGERKIEVFNITAYLEQAGDSDDDEMLKNVEKLQEFIVRALKQLSPDDPGPPPSFQFHQGANLLIVTGRPEAIDVARKVVNAVSATDSAQLGSSPGMPLVPARSGRTLPMTKERRAILNKLETIRLDSIAIDALPLNEVVRILSDSVKKHDPSKTGINFMIDPSQPPGGMNPTPGLAIDPTTGTPIAQEMVDIQSVSVRINPPLNNVRLSDVLDAIVRVADQPIKYIVTDYAVVFALRRADEPQLSLPGKPRYRMY